MDRNIDQEISSLKCTLKKLRSKDGCPWDREQSIDDIITNLIDEAYELLRAEKSGNIDKIIEELGDVLYLTIFIHELLTENHSISLESIISGVHHKIVRRHPHIFGESKADTVAKSIREWERIKESEGANHILSSLVDQIPTDLPPLRKVSMIQKKAAEIGFDWPHRKGIIEKLEEEIQELREAVHKNDRSKVKDEIGDLIFTAINLARRFDVEPENAIEGTSQKFLTRYKKMEELAQNSGEDLNSLSLEKLEELWQRSKDQC